MPRNASKVFYNLPGTEGFPDTTIESVKYNNYISDVAFDLNLPRPIIAGGTGAGDADGALINLSAEKASQFVSNFDTHIWLPGSFRSSTGATASPVSGHAFVGDVHINDFLTNPPLNENVVVTARDMNDPVTPKRVYVREKKAGTWLNSGAWTVLDATTLPFTPGGSISATTIQAAIQELDTEKASIVYVDNLNTAMTAYVDSNINDTIVFLDSEITAVQDDLNTLAATAGSLAAANGIQINGAFEASGGMGGPATATGYVTDCWKMTKVSGGSVAVSASIGTLHAMQQLGFEQMLNVAVITPQASLGASDCLYIHQPIEGFRTVHLAWGTPNAQPITIGFWSAHSPGGVGVKYSLSVHNGGNTRSYTTSYEQTTGPSVPQYHSITIPGDTTGGMWETFNQTGISIIFTMAAGIGSLQTSNVNQWQDSPAIAATGQINGWVSTINAFRVTGLVVLPGAHTLTAANSALLMRSEDVEAQLCRRYYYRRVVSMAGYAAAGGTVMGWFAHPVQPRIYNSTITNTGGTATNTSGVVTVGGMTGFNGQEGFTCSIPATGTGDCRLVDFVQTMDARL